MLLCSSAFVQSHNEVLRLLGGGGFECTGLERRSRATPPTTTHDRHPLSLRVQVHYSCFPTTINHYQPPSTTVTNSGHCSDSMKVGSSLMGEQGRHVSMRVAPRRTAPHLAVCCNARRTPHHAYSLTPHHAYSTALITPPHPHHHTAPPIEPTAQARPQNWPTTTRTR